MTKRSAEAQIFKEDPEPDNIEPQSGPTIELSEIQKQEIANRPKFKGGRKLKRNVGEDLPTLPVIRRTDSLATLDTTDLHNSFLEQSRSINDEDASEKAIGHNLSNPSFFDGTRSNPSYIDEYDTTSIDSSLIEDLNEDSGLCSHSHIDREYLRDAKSDEKPSTASSTSDNGVDVSVESKTDFKVAENEESQFSGDDFVRSEISLDSQISSDEVKDDESGFSGSDKFKDDESRLDTLDSVLTEDQPNAGTESPAADATKTISKEKETGVVEKEQKILNVAGLRLDEPAAIKPAPVGNLADIAASRLENQVTFAQFGKFSVEKMMQKAPLKKWDEAQIDDQESDEGEASADSGPSFTTNALSGEADENQLFDSRNAILLSLKFDPETKHNIVKRLCDALVHVNENKDDKSQRRLLVRSIHTLHIMINYTLPKSGMRPVVMKHNSSKGYDIALSVFSESADKTSSEKETYLLRFSNENTRDEFNRELSKDLTEDLKS